MSAIKWLGGWLLFIILLVGLAQTKAGKTIVYYLLWLAVVFLILTHYQEIQDIFAGAGIATSGGIDTSLPVKNEGPIQVA